jgi:hypothetical protein
MTLISYSAVLELLVLLYGIWRYRKNKIIALGAITLGLAGMAFGLSKLRGVPDWVPGVFVLVFLVLSVLVLLLPVFYLFRWSVGKLKRRDAGGRAKVPTP